MGAYQILIVFVLSLVACSYGARILAYIPTPSYSHQVVFQPLWRELSLRGHKVTLLTTNPINDPTLTNLTEIDLGFSYEKLSEVLPKLMKASTIESLNIYTDFFHYNADLQLNHSQVKKLINESSFDLVIAEYLTLIPFAFAEKFQCPSVAVTSLAALERMYRNFGVPTHPVLYPNYLLPFSKANTILNRIMSVIFESILDLYLELYSYPAENLLIKKHFGPNSKTAAQLSENISLLLENTEPVLNTVRPRIPLVIPIGGIHRVPGKPLPNDIKRILDSATNGFIYFSLGSNVKSKDLPERLKKTILKTFAELPYTVLWKFELENLPDRPKNVFISKWLPQTDVLSHPNIKLFITQAGLQSLEESFVSRVPMVAIPYIADQPKNAMKMVENGFGVSLDHKTMTKDSFKKAILEVITNPKYRNKISKLSDLADDQPMTSLERAVWWIEYVIRHKGTQHLRSPALDIPLYQYYMLDVIGVLLGLLGLVIYVCCFVTRKTIAIVKLLVNMIFGPKKKVE